MYSFLRNHGMNVKIYHFSTRLCVLSRTLVQWICGVAFLHSWLYILGGFDPAHASTVLSVLHLHLLVLVPYLATHSAPFTRIRELVATYCYLFNNYLFLFYQRLCLVILLTAAISSYDLSYCLWIGRCPLQLMIQILLMWQVFC